MGHKRTLEITPLTDQWNGEELTRSCRVDFREGDKTERTETLWYRFETSQLNAPDPQDCSSYLITLILDAMSEARDIIVNGQVPRSLLSNLTEWQTVFHHWYPDDYTIVQIHADNILPEAKQQDGAVCAFSGGLDSVYTAWTHAKGKAGHRSQDIKLGVLVYGFDIPLGRDEVYADCCAGAREMLEDLSIPFAAMATNYRELSTLNWEHTHGAALVATLRNFKALAGTCLIGGSYLYNKSWPLGSSPVTDHLLSDKAFHIIHDAAAVTRPAKAEAVAEWSFGADRLRVCYLSEDHNNCGNCFKCWVTQLAFLSVEKTPPKSLDFPIDRKALRKEMLYFDNEFFNMSDIVDEADARGVKGWWVRTLKYIIFKSHVRNLVRKGYW